MTENMKHSVPDFKLPKYSEIPNVGLYLEQTAKYISECLAPLGTNMVTGSMISNYVKKGLISNPVKKQYNREQIAYLIFIVMAKAVLSIEDIKLMIELQQKTYDSSVAYTYLSEELENVFDYVFGIKDKLENPGNNNHDVKIMLRTVVITIVHKVYLDMFFASYRNEKES